MIGRYIIHRDLILKLYHIDCVVTMRFILKLVNNKHKFEVEILKCEFYNPIFMKKFRIFLTLDFTVFVNSAGFHFYA